MARIHLLDTLTANQIAAGEVIERPVSVVKELVENSLDAGASKIVVEINQGGLSFIKVSDNGCGMAEEDLPLAIMRHATSKLKQITDLDQIHTLGFRGEALPSIVSVAKVEIVSRRPEDQIGRKLVVSGQKQPQCEPVGAPSGTTITVHDLFYNTPARKKFLRSEGYESALIHDLLTRFSLSHPEVSFLLFRNGREILNTAGMDNLPNLIQHYYGNEAREALIEIEGELPGGLLFGYTTLPTYHRKNRKDINLFINHRRVFSKELLNAVEEAYRDTLPKGQFPLCVLKLQLDPSTIDVNVHPSKLEVRLRNPLLAKELTSLLQKLLLAKKKVPLYFTSIEPKQTVTKSKNPCPERQESQTTLETLQTYEAVREPSEWPKPEITPASAPSTPTGPDTTSFPTNATTPAASADQAAATTMPVTTMPAETSMPVATTPPTGTSMPPAGFTAPETAVSSANRPEPPDLSATQAQEQEDIGSLKLIGQLYQTFILAEGKEGLYLIDQHIAHERVLYEGFLANDSQNAMESQVLLQPVTLHLSPLEEETVLKFILPLVDLGIILEHFGPHTYLLRAIPAGIDEAPQDYFYSLLEHLETSRGKTTVLDIKKEFLIHTACKRAVKANTSLTKTQMEGLLRDLSSTKNYLTCPHGRPIIYKITQQEIFKAFHRI